MASKTKSATQIYFNKDHEMVRKAVREFVEKEINPYMNEWEARSEAPLHELFKKMGDLGFLGIRYDPQYGGQGLDYWYDTVFLEELGRIHGSGVPVAGPEKLERCLAGWAFVISLMRCPAPSFS